MPEEAIDAREAQAMDFIAAAAAAGVSPTLWEPAIAWRGADLENDLAFWRALRVWRALSHLPPAASPRLWTGPRSRRAAMGGLVLAAAGGGVFLSGARWDQGSRPEIRTGVGEVRQAELQEGVLALNTASAASVSRSAEAVRILLRHGEIMGSPAGAPFEIVSGAVTTRIIAGRALVRRDGATIDITCTAGRVRCRGRADSLQLEAGSQARYLRGRLLATQQVNAADAEGWVHGTLSYREVPLETVLADLDRYWPGRVVLVAQGEIAARLVSGAFPLAKVDKAIEAVAVSSGAQVTRLPGGLYLIA